MSEKYNSIPCINCGSEPENHQVYIKTKVTHHGHLRGDPLTVVICTVCGLVFLNPQPTPQALNRFYSEEYYAGPKNITADYLTSSKKWQHDFLFSWLSAYLPGPINGLNILDIGAGYGAWLQWFGKSNQVTGIESSRQACEVARTVFGLKMLETDFLSNNLTAEEFDLITGLAIIEHFNDPLEALVEMNRLLKTGGYLYLQTPDIHGMVLRQGIHRYYKIVHTYYFSLVTLTNLLAKAGFAIAASRCRPPLVETSGVLCPDNYWSGELDILARKEVDKRLFPVQEHPNYCNDTEAALASLDKALIRDKGYIFYAKIHRMPLIRIPFKMLFRFARVLSLPRSIFEVQRDKLNLG
jgi:2-polyprenyl-3-methyl-5-hydroxy-6-metoxy-1,4-benzoquinol methylase